MKTEQIKFQGSGRSLPGYLWMPEQSAKAMLLAVHGMTEHAGRYDTFAETMTAQGFAVAAYDLRGHGKNAPDPDCAAMDPGDWEKSIDDIGLVLGQLQERFPGQPLYLLGFSLGSFLVREYMEREDTIMDGVILIGTGWQPGWLMKIMRAVVNTQIQKAGYGHTTTLVRKLSFEAYNQKFKPNRTGSDWLCADPKELDAYLSDELCRGDIASGTFYELLGSMERTGRPLKQRQTNQIMPVLLICGDQDPVGNFGKGITAVHRQLKQSGYPVFCRTFSGARHMLLHEEAGGQAAQARECIIEWIRSHI